ncbi:MAG: pyridoxamine 5'-phosphate oxidase family protein [Thaumarchaeota archaeon]|nr:pyridoxamine 5'-phosphate oxidase family protein [Nitrososphaerota archaeon]
MSGNQGDIPNQVLDVLKTSQIGYLSVTSSKGELYSYPVAFYFGGLKVYFMTPISAAKLKFIRGNPSVSFLVDNHLLTKGSCGAMVQGKAKVFSITKTVLSILSVGPKMAHFAKKYPGMFTFYASGKELPDERKLYKYRLIRIDPSKIVFWTGYQFGKYLTKGKPSSEIAADSLGAATEDEKMETFAQLLKSADEELPVPEGVKQSEEWIEGLNEATEQGIITKDERSTIDSYRGFLRHAASSSQVPAKVTDEEKKLLGKWKKSPSK